LKAEGKFEIYEHKNLQSPGLERAEVWCCAGQLLDCMPSYQILVLY